MTEKITSKIQFCANVAIILAVLVGGYHLIRHDLMRAQPVSQPRQSTRLVPTAGTKIPLSGVDWAGNGRTMLFVLSTSCKFCKENAPFYQTLIRESRGLKDLHLLAMLPQEVDESKRYLTEMGLEIGDVRRSRPEEAGTTGFPTLMLLDNRGTIEKAWVGKLTPEKEVEVLNLMKCANCT
ncbi:MAG TPA: hypothetical protein VFV34_06395 [Blastocatellia bacterium]|nr:hypothetical protein [Blastocatellia bacterium]